MSFTNKFPYTTINNINLDWIIKRVKELGTTVRSFAQDIARAVSLAEAAQEAADSVTSTAESAVATAQAAEATANAIAGTANTALATAQAAETTAQAAETTANAIAGTANTALATAQAAETTAQAAETAAQTAVDRATSAETTAGTASANASNAVQTANTALATAEAANTTAQAAQTAAQAAQTAAQAAQTTAQAAQTTAGTAITNVETLETEVANQKSAIAKKAGMLVDTASGAIASFVPDSTIPDLLGVTVDVEPVQAGSGNPSPENVRPISGWDAVAVQRTGKNLNPWDGVNFTADTHPAGFWLNAGDYVFSLDTGGSFGFGNNFYIKLKDRDGNVITDGNISGAGWTLNSTRQYYYGFGNVYTSAPFTLLTDCFFCFGFNNTKPTANGVQLELGSTATAYEPYQGETYTIDLDGTRYGGTLDVTTGKLTVDRAMVDLGAIAWGYQSSPPQFYSNGIAETSINWHSWNDTPPLICSRYKPISNALLASSDFCIGYAYNSKQLCVNDSGFTDAASFKTAMSGVQLVYELATPIEIQLDSVTIATIANQTNNVWADAGDVAVTFAADLKTYIDQKIAAAVAALS